MFWVWFWLAIVVVAIILEAITMDLVSMWFVIGGFVGMILGACQVAPWIQALSSIAVSFVCLVFLRKFALKLLKRDNSKTNLDLVIGKKAELIEAVTEYNPGTAKVNGLIWNVVSVDGNPIPEKTQIEVVEICGNKLVVKKTEA